MSMPYWTITVPPQTLPTLLQAVRASGWEAVAYSPVFRTAPEAPPSITAVKVFLSRCTGSSPVLPVPAL